MTDIKKLLTQKENRKLEFKRELPSKEKIVKTVIAFANSQGANLIIGVDDTNQVVGIDEENIVKYEEVTSSVVYDNCLPSIIPEIFSFRIEDKILLVVHIYPSNQKPNFIKAEGKYKGTVVRVGSTNRMATLEVLESLERQKRKISFDSVIVHECEYRTGIFKQIDKQIISKLHEKSDISTYEKLKFIKQERESYYLTNLGVLFSEKRSEYFPLVKIECARFKGRTTKVFLDQAIFDKDIISSIEQTIEFIKRNIKLGAIIGEVYREDSRE